MRCFILLICLLAGARAGWGQQGFPLYYRYLALVGRADSASAAQHYAAAGRWYGQAARASTEKAIELPRAENHFKAARAWAAAGQPDSALAYLGSAARLNWAETPRLQQEAAFRSLQTDKRWPLLLARVERNRQQQERQARLYTERTTFGGPGAEVVFAPPTPYLRQFLYNDTLPFISVNHGNFRLYFRGNSFTAAHLSDAKQQLTDALTRGLAVVGHRGPYSKGYHVVFVDSKSELQALTGFSVAGGIALPGYDALFLVHTPTRRLQARHELFHLLSYDVWGATTSRLLNEGAAVFADNECRYPDALYGLNAYMLQQQKTQPLTDLVNQFDQAARKGEVAAYLQSAGIVRYLYEQYGAEKLQRLWKAGFGEFERIYGLPLTRFEQQWQAFIRKVPVPKAVNWEQLQKEGCG